METKNFTAISLKEAETWIKKNNRQFFKHSLPAGIEAYSHALLCEGSWVGSNLSIPASTLMMVGGDLIAKHWICTEDEEYNSQSISELIVAGNVSTHDMAVSQEVIVDGNLSVSRLLFADSSGDLTLHVSGNLNAQYADFSNHNIKVNGSTSASVCSCSDLKSVVGNIREGNTPIEGIEN